MQMYLAYLLLLSVQAILFSRNMSVPCRIDGKTVLKKKDGTRFFLMLSCIELIIFTGLRGYTVGADTATYLDALSYYTGISFSEIFTAKLVFPFDFEVGYFLLTKICGFLKLSPTIFLFIIATAIYVPLFEYIYKNSSHPYISVVVYFGFGFFSYSLGIFRQFIAIGIILSALKYVEQRKLVKYVICICIAMLFHMTALIALPLYFFARINWRKNIFIIMTLISEAVLMVVGIYVIKLAVTILPAYSNYFKNSYGSASGSYLNLIFLNIVFFAFIFANRNSPQNDIKLNLTAAQLVLAIMLQCCAYHMAIFGRIVPYFSISALMIAIPSIIDGLSKRDKLLSYILKTGACMILFALVLREFIGNQYVCPFYFFWENSPV